MVGQRAAANRRCRACARLAGPARRFGNAGDRKASSRRDERGRYVRGAGKARARCTRRRVPAGIRRRDGVGAACANFGRRRSERSGALAVGRRAEHRRPLAHAVCCRTKRTRSGAGRTSSGPRSRRLGEVATLVAQRHNDGKEHFGFSDGIAQPAIRGEDRSEPGRRRTRAPTTSQRANSSSVTSTNTGFHPMFRS